MILKAMAILLALALLTIGIQTWRVSHYKARADSLQAVANTLHEANQTNLATIADLQVANRQWADKCTANQPEARQQAQLSVQGDAKRQAAAQKSIKSLRATYEREPTVRAWADVPVPRVVADRLREAGNQD